MPDVFLEGGWPTFPTMLFGVVAMGASALVAVRPERRFVPLVIALSVMTLSTSLLGCIIGLLGVVKALANAAPADVTTVSQTELLSILGKDAQARTVANIDACVSGRSAAGPLVPGLQPVIALRPLEATGSRVVLTAWGGDQFAGPLPWPPGSPTSGPSGVGSAEGRCAQGRAEEVAVRASPPHPISPSIEASRVP